MDAARVSQDHDDVTHGSRRDTIAKDGSTITFQGWVVFPPNVGNPIRMTITATTGGAKLVQESAKQL